MFYHLGVAYLVITAAHLGSFALPSLLSSTLADPILAAAAAIVTCLTALLILLPLPLTVLSAWPSSVTCFIDWTPLAIMLECSVTLFCGGVAVALACRPLHSSIIASASRRQSGRISNPRISPAPVLFDRTDPILEKILVPIAFFYLVVIGVIVGCVTISWNWPQSVAVQYIYTILRLQGVWNLLVSFLRRNRSTRSRVSFKLLNEQAKLRRSTTDIGGGEPQRDSVEWRRSREKSISDRSSKQRVQLISVVDRILEELIKSNLVPSPHLLSSDHVADVLQKRFNTSELESLIAATKKLRVKVIDIIRESDREEPNDEDHDDLEMIDDADAADFADWVDLERSATIEGPSNVPANKM